MNFYDFSKFWIFSELNKSFLIYLKSRKGLLRQPDTIMTSAGQPGTVHVKPDQWDPLVSDPVTFSVTDRGVRSTATSVRSTPTSGATMFRLNLNYFVRWLVRQWGSHVSEPGG